MTNDDDGIITLRGDDGQRYRCRILQFFDYEDEAYAILLRLEPPEDEGMIIMRVIERDGQNLFQTIESEAEFDEVVAYVHAMAEAMQDEHEHL